MATVLCEQCFPGLREDGKEYEVKTIVPMSPCVECGEYDDRYKGGPVAHLYAGDPRAEAKKNG